MGKHFLITAASLDVSERFPCGLRINFKHRVFGLTQGIKTF